jgi:hypothetical protein
MSEAGEGRSPRRTSGAQLEVTSFICTKIIYPQVLYHLGRSGMYLLGRQVMMMNFTVCGEPGPIKRQVLYHLGRSGMYQLGRQVMMINFTVCGEPGVIKRQVLYHLGRSGMFHLGRQVLYHLERSGMFHLGRQICYHLGRLLALTNDLKFRGA